MKGLTSHLSCAYDTFSSYCVSFSLMTSLTMMVLGLGHMVRAVFILLRSSGGFVSSSKSVGGVSGLFSAGHVSGLFLLVVSVEH